MLHFDEPEKKEYELIEEGDYEVTLSAEWKEYNGNKTINCTFKIRKDVEQDFGGRLVFDTIYKKKGTDEFSPAKISGILGAIPNSKKDFEDYDELIQYINGANMVVTITKQDADPAYNTKEKNIIKYLSYAPSAQPVTAEGQTEKPKLEPVDESNDPLPF